MNEYEVIIGLEIHMQLKTDTKMFCSCPNVGGDAEPGTAVCPVCMGHPGTLPVINQGAVRQGIRLALALQCRIASLTRFDRKNYFYPDLPKGYQISQFDRPLAIEGTVSFRRGGVPLSFALERLHLEEDAAKNVHRNDETRVDFNRAGTPLAEIVTKPDFRSPEDTRAFLQELQLIARYLEVSDADMEKGQLRCDANISLRPIGDTKLYPKIEIKNLNSFRSVEKALAYEVTRQTVLWDANTPPQIQETRGWDEIEAKTVLQRTKEGSDDYRYFPEPDLPPVSISEETIKVLSELLPELPEAKRNRFYDEYRLSYDEASVIVADKKIAEFFEDVISELRQTVADRDVIEGESANDAWQRMKYKLVKLAHSWITSELYKYLNADSVAISELKITPENMSEFIRLIYDGKVNSSAAQTILDRMYHAGGDPSHIAEDEKLFQINDEDALRYIVQDVVHRFPSQVADFKNGKEPILQFLIGQVMRASSGAANPEVVAGLLKEEIKKH